uniref:Fibronectin type-III domain-containing protein n=1 Tax=Biomphalaria glabrata TaxID=6526 RepID=A0A2C9LBS3_BIOGL
MVNVTINSPIEIRNTLHIKFTTDGSVEKDGFIATFHMQELSYGSVCSLSIGGMCKGPDMVCRYDKIGDTRCLCPVGKYHDNGRCHMVLIYEIQTLTTEANLVLPRGSYFIRHNIAWSLLDDPLDHHKMYTNAITNVHLTDLTPGHEYVLGVVSTLKADDYVDEFTIQTNTSFLTMPAQPGEVLEEESNLNTPPYVLKFNSSQGIVHHYNITLVSDTQVLIYQIMEAELVTSDLTADTLYNYTITAFNKLGNESTTFGGNITTGPAHGVNIKTSLVIGLSSAGVLLIIICVVITTIIATRCKRQREAKTELTLKSMPVQYKTDTSRTYSGLPTKNKPGDKKGSDHGYEGLQLGYVSQQHKDESCDDDLYMNAAAINENTEDFYEDFS